MKRCIILMSLLLFACIACADKQLTTDEDSESQNAKRTKTTGRTPSTEPSPSKSKGGDSVNEKVRTTFAAILTNDDKKAKLAYGRNYRFMPDFIQFAVDLRFKNYDHALQILEKLQITPEEKEFWSKILKAKPARLVPPICEALKSSESLSFSESKEQVKWNQEIEELVQTLIPEKAKSAPPAELDITLDQLQCKHTGATPQCEPLTPELQQKLLTDAFFDKLHNMQVRDTHFVKWNYKNYIKVREYRRYVSLSSLHKFFHTIQSTQSDKQIKFLKRFRGIGRDLRPENIVSRVFGDLVVGDEKDTILAEHIESFVQSYPILNLAMGLEFELANCGLPADMPAFKMPKKVQ
jgi:hypothetical protein